MLRPVAVIDMFAGAGGAALGFIQGGALVVSSFDNWEPANAVHRMNTELPHTVTTMELGTIQAWSHIMALAEAFRRSGFHVHIHASPPCQAFSTASTTRASEGTYLLDWTLDLIKMIQPDSWSLENVPPTRKWLPEWCEDKWQFVMCADYGVPQTRKRMIAGEGFTLTPTHESRHTLHGDKEFLPDWVSVLDALPHLDSMELKPPPSMVKQYQYASIRKPFPTVTSFSARQLRLEATGANAKRQSDSELTEPSRTICGSGNQCGPRIFDHDSEKPVKVRSLTITETAILQGFPADYDFEPAGSQKARWTMIGNALPPQITKAIFEGLIR